MNSTVTVSPGSTWALNCNHSVPAPLVKLLSQPPIPVPTSSSVPDGQAPGGAPGAGKHTVMLKMPGYETLTETVDVKEGNEPTTLKNTPKKKGAE